MGNDDVLILTIYALVVFYVLYQMALSLESLQEDQIKISLDVDTLEQKVRTQLSLQPNANQIQAKVEDSSDLLELLKKLAEASGQEISKEQKKRPPQKQLTLSPKAIFERPQLEADAFVPPSNISFTVLPQGKKPLKPPIKFLGVEVSNRTADYQVYIDWDRSTITYRNQQGQRAIRMLPGESFELSQRQVYSVINPGQQIKTTVTTEDSFSRNNETQRLEVKDPLINIEQLALFLIPQEVGGKDKSGADGKGGKPDSNKATPYSKKSIYTLTLGVSIKSLVEPESQATNLLVPFNFDVSLLPGEIAFPPLRWLLSRPRHRVENIVTSVLTGRPSRYRR